MLFVQSALLFSSCINLLPISGVIGPNKLAQLYGITISDANELLMMRHRAVLFGAVGGILGASVVHKPLRRVAYCVGLTSMASYVLLVLSQGVQSFNPEIQRVFWVDILGVVWLGIAAFIDRFGAATEQGSGAKNK